MRSIYFVLTIVALILTLVLAGCQSTAPAPQAPAPPEQAEEAPAQEAAEPEGEPIVIGASLPLTVVFTIYREPLWYRINREPITEEIVRTLVGSIGLILAVPITGLIASLVARWAIRNENEQIGSSQGQGGRERQGAQGGE